MTRDVTSSQVADLLGVSRGTIANLTDAASCRTVGRRTGIGVFARRTFTRTGRAG